MGEGGDKKQKPKELMQKMYKRALELHQQEGLGDRRIQKRLTKEFGCTVSRSTIYRWIKGLRSPYGDGGLNKSPEEYKREKPLVVRRALFERVRQLGEEGLSQLQIQRRIKEETGYPLSRSTISYWLRGIHTPYRHGRKEGGKRRRQLRVGPELSYILGAALGDGSTLYDEKRESYRVTLSAKDLDFVMEFARCFAVVTGKDAPYKIRLRKDGKWVCEGFSKAVCQLVKGGIEKLKPVVEQSDENIRAFIRGFCDAEGGVIRSGYIIIVNTCKDLIDYIADLLQKLQIAGKIYERKLPKISIIKGRVAHSRHEVIYRLKISRKDNLRRFAQLVGFVIQRKQRRLEEIIKCPSTNPLPLTRSPNRTEGEPRGDGSSPSFSQTREADIMVIIPPPKE